MKSIIRPSDLTSMEPRLLVSLKKSVPEGKAKGGWSDNARAAAVAARKSKAESVTLVVSAEKKAK